MNRFKNFAFLMGPVVLLTACNSSGFGTSHRDTSAQTDTTAPAPTASHSPTSPTATLPSPTATLPAPTLPPSTGTVPSSVQIYAHDERYLYSYDPASNSETLVGRFSPPGGGIIGNMSDLAVSATGQLIGISCYGYVYSIDPVTVESVPALTYPGGGDKLTFLRDGKLIGGYGSRLTEIDLPNRRISSFAQSQTFQSTGDVVGLPDGYLYESVSEGGSDALVKINRVNGQTVRIGSIGYAEVHGLAYANGKLYGFSGAGEILEISPATGRGVLLRRTSTAYTGAASRPAL